MKLLPPPLLLLKVSKLRNWIASPILNGSSSSKLDLKGVICSFKTPPGTSKMSEYSYNKWRYSLHLSFCIKGQNSEIELQAQYSTDSQALSWTLKMWFVALRRIQERAKRAGIHVQNKATLSISPATSIIKSSKWNCTSNTQWNHKIKADSESYCLQLSDASNSNKNDQKYVLQWTSYSSVFTDHVTMWKNQRWWPSVLKISREIHGI